MSNTYYTRKRNPIQARFEKFIYFDPMSGCWIWLGSRKSSYGQFYLNGKDVYAHRASWEIYKGNIYKGMYICHHCDISLCVNPYHLFMGTAKDNAIDAVNKGRIVHGEKHYCSKFTEEQIKLIRKDKRGNTVISTDYNVTPQYICRIKRREIWKYI